MKKIISLVGFPLSFLAIFSFLLGTQTACHKENTNCGALITVKDSVNNPVPGATVKLYAPNSKAGNSGVTNSTGEIYFSFTLPAIFDIEAYQVVAPKDTVKGTGIIQLQIGQTISTTVNIP